MRTLLKKLFLNNWSRKFLSIIIATMIWLIMDKSMVTTKTIVDVPVRVKNIPKGETIADMQPNGVLNRRVNLTLTGSKTVLKDLSSSDIEVVFDALGKQGEWISTISKKNIQTDNPDIKITRGISKVAPQNFLIKLSKLIVEKIPIIVTQPIGTPPKGYEFLGIWPYQLYMTVNGPEDAVRKLKSSGIKLTFNLSSISRSSLDELSASSSRTHGDVVSYFVPNYWKRVSLPTLSPHLVEINDPNARLLRIDFSRNEQFKIKHHVPVTLFFPPHVTQRIDPQKVQLETNEVLKKQDGLYLMRPSLYAKGVSRFFFELVQDMFQIVILVDPEDGDHCLQWDIQFVNSGHLENLYVQSLMSDVGEQPYKLQPLLREKYLRHRFRNYINRFELTTSAGEKLEICPTLQGESVILKEKTEHGT